MTHKGNAQINLDLQGDEFGGPAWISYGASRHGMAQG